MSNLPYDLLPSDCPLQEPVVATSDYLNRPSRSLIAAVRDISAVRDMPLWVWDDLLRPSTVVSLAAERQKRRGG